MGPTPTSCTDGVNELRNQVRGREGADGPGKIQLVAPRGRGGLLSWLEQARLGPRLVLPPPPLGLHMLPCFRESSIRLAKCTVRKDSFFSSPCFFFLSLFLLSPPPSFHMQLRLATNPPLDLECWAYRAHYHIQISQVWYFYCIYGSPLVCGCTCAHCRVHVMAR